MCKRLCSVGLDVGTTTTQLIVSEIGVQNRASAFAVPKMEITHRTVRYQSPVHFTPLLSKDLVDGEGVREIVAREYEQAGIRPEDVDTGAIIITGETSRKENARAVLEALSAYAGTFVVATAGPDLESILAAKGAGAPALSERLGKTVLHMDIGGGTSNLALCREGKIVATGCLNVGGRLLKLDAGGTITYVSPVLAGNIPYEEGDTITQAQGEDVARLLASALEMAAARIPPTAWMTALTNAGEGPWEAEVLSFSGGVADCIEKEVPWLTYGDLGPLLGKAIRESTLCHGAYRLGAETIRATVIGAGCHSTQLSGSTVYLQNISLPLQNLPVAYLEEAEQNLPREALSRCIRQRMEALEQWGVLYLPGWKSPHYVQITALADGVAEAMGDRPCYLALREDMAKALGHALQLRLPKETPCLCIDRVDIPRDSFLDVGNAVGPAICVVVKTLVFEKEGS